MAILIRAAEPDDIKALLALDTYLPSDPHRAHEIDAWVRGGTCVAAQVEGEVIGYAASGIFFRRPLIEIVMVAAAWRGRGVGRALVRFFCERSSGQEVWTSTNESNAAMRALLVAQGFVFAGTLDGLNENDPEQFYCKPVADKLG